MANNLLAFNAIAFSKKLIMNLDKINIMLPLVNKDYEGDIKNIGDSVKVRTLGGVTMNPYTKNATTISYEDLAPSSETFTIADAQYFAFKVDDVDKAQTDMMVLDLYAKRAAVSVNEKIEAKLLSYYASAHADNKITGAANAAVALDKDNIYPTIVKARVVLNKKNVPTNDRWMVVDPDTEALLLQSDYFVKNATESGARAAAEGQINGMLKPGFIGRVAGFDVYTSNQIPTAAGAKFLQFGDKYAISYAAQINDVEQIRLQTSFADAVRGLLLHDAVVFAECAKRFGTIKAAA